MKFISFIIFLALTQHALAESNNTTKIAVIDTGFDFYSTWKEQKNIVRPILCKRGHKSFIVGDSKLNDNHGHGTHVAGIIAQYAEGQDYCLLILKYYADNLTFSNTLEFALNAIQYAIEQNVDIINYSGGGQAYSGMECYLIKKALDRGIMVITAAGNESSDLEEKPYYPALCDPRVIAVTNMEINTQLMTGKRILKNEKPKEIRQIAQSSNFGNTVRTTIFNEFGVNVKSTLPNNQIGVMSGTSQATATVTGKMVKFISMMKLRYKKIDKKK